MDANWSLCIASFLQSIEDISGSVRSRDMYAYILNRFFADGRNPDQYTRSDVQAFIDAPSALRYTRGQPVKPGTRNQRLMVLNSFYKFAANCADGMLLQVRPPTLGIRYLKTGPTYKALTAGEVERLFAAIPNSSIKGLRDRAVLLTFFWTGRRRSEIARLVWGDIEQAIIIDDDGSRRPGVVYRYIAKGKSREVQTAELPAPAWHAIIAYVEQSGRLATMRPDSPLFSSTRHDQPEQQLTGDYANRLFKYYARLAGLSPRYSLHSLRHAAARLRYMAGSSIQDVQMFLGHSSIGTTDVYLRRLTGVSDPGAKLLEERFGHL